MAQIQSRVLDLNQLMSIYGPFFQRQAEIQKANEEKLIALGTLADLVNSAPENSQTYKDYYRVMDELTNYAADMSKGMHVAGYNSARTANLFRDYGMVTGRINRINKEIEDSRTRRQAAMVQHPGAIFKQNNVSSNIDALANGEHIDDSFTDAETITKIMQTQAEAIGMALDNKAIYTRIPETEEYRVEVLQHGGIKAKILNDIWTKGYSSDLTAEGNELIRGFLNNAKGMMGYGSFDNFGKSQIDGLALNSLTAALQKDKVNVIDSEKPNREDIASREKIAFKDRGGSSGGKKRSTNQGKRGNSKNDGNKGATPKPQQKKNEPESKAHNFE